MEQSNQPLYGQGQIAGYLNNLNSLANKSIESLQGNLARRGALSSGAATSGMTDIGLGRMGQQANFMANVPLMNRTAQLQSAQTYGGLGNQLMGVAPRTQDTTQSGQQSGTSHEKDTQTPSIMSDIGQVVGIAGAAMGMPGLGGGMSAPNLSAMPSQSPWLQPNIPGMGAGGNFNSTIPSPDPNLFGGGRAEGGPLNPGKWYIAGEKGPEAIWGGGPGAFAAGPKMQPHNLMWNRG